MLIFQSSSLPRSLVLREPEHIPKKSLDFFDSGMLQRFEAERFLIAQMESIQR
jgi:hypothetical protein